MPGLNPFSPEAAGRAGPWLLLAIGAAAFLFVVNFQLSTGAHQATHVDEYYYSACAVRGLDIGAIPVPSCHDNKGPLVYLLYEAIFKLAGAYNYVAVKLVAYLLSLLNIAVLARIAFRRSGTAAAAITAGLMLLCLSTDVANIALRSDLVGGLCLTLALLALSAPGASRSPAHIALAGLAIGTAIVTKQNFAFAGLAILLWLLVGNPVRSSAQARVFAGGAAVFGLCALAPFAVFWLIFDARNAVGDFLSSFLLYPLIYSAARGNPAVNFIRHGGALLAGLMEQILLAAMAAWAAVTVILADPAARVPGRFADFRWLLIFVIAFLLLALTALPYWLPYYIVMVAGPMALLAGIALAEHLYPVSRPWTREALASLAALLFGATIFAAQTWHSNAKTDDNAMPPRHMPLVHAAPDGRYAYELGTQPDFYAEGGFVPASSVQFSWALPGTPDNWSYIKPQPGTPTRRWLDRRQAENLARLYGDFARTPPRYIMLDSDFVRAAGSPNAVDIPGFQDYLDRNCRLLARTSPRLPATTSLYRCRNPAGP